MLAYKLGSFSSLLRRIPLSAFVGSTGDSRHPSNQEYVAFDFILAGESRPYMDFTVIRAAIISEGKLKKLSVQTPIRSLLLSPLLLPPEPDQFTRTPAATQPLQFVRHFTCLKAPRHHTACSGPLDSFSGFCRAADFISFCSRVPHRPVTDSFFLVSIATVIAALAAAVDRPFHMLFHSFGSVIPSHFSRRLRKHVLASCAQSAAVFPIIAAVLYRCGTRVFPTA